MYSFDTRVLYASGDSESWTRDLFKAHRNDRTATGMLTHTFCVYDFHLSYSRCKAVNMKRLSFSCTVHLVISNFIKTKKNALNAIFEKLIAMQLCVHLYNTSTATPLKRCRLNSTHWVFNLVYNSWNSFEVDAQQNLNMCYASFGFLLFINDDWKGIYWTRRMNTEWFW